MNQSTQKNIKTIKKHNPKGVKRHHISTLQYKSIEIIKNHAKCDALYT